MKYIVTLSLCLLFCGCNQAKKLIPEPKISIEINDNTDDTTITIRYKHHTTYQGECYQKLDTPEEIQQYKKQVEFLLKRLEEAQQKMNVHEPEQ